MAVMTTARAKQLAWPELSGSSQDTLIGGYVDAAESTIAAYLGMPPYLGSASTLAVQSYTLYPHGDGSPVLELGISPAVAVTSVHISRVRDYSANNLLASTEYTLETGAGQIVLDWDGDYSTWPRGDRVIKAVVTAGYATLPGQLEQAVAMFARHLWGATQRKLAGVSSKSGNGGSMQYEPDAIPTEVRVVLAPFRNPLALLG